MSEAKPKEDPGRNRVSELREALQMLSSAGADGVSAKGGVVGVTTTAGHFNLSPRQRQRLAQFGWTEGEGGWQVKL